MVVAGPYQSRFECDLNAPCRFTLQDQGVNLWPGDLIRSGVSGCAAPDASGELREASQRKGRPARERVPQSSCDCGTIIKL